MFWNNYEIDDVLTTSNLLHKDDQSAVDEAAAEEPSAIELAIADVDFGEFAGMEDLMVDLFETVFDPEVMKELKKDGKGQEVK